MFKLQNVSLILHLQCVYYGVRQMQTAHGQVNEVNIAVKCSNRLPISKLDLQRTESFKGRESVEAFHKKVYLIYMYLAVCCLRKWLDEAMRLRCKAIRQ